MSADDTSISYSSNSISTINNAVNEDLESLKTWLEEEKLSLNVAKTNCILKGSRNKIRELEQSMPLYHPSILEMIKSLPLPA